MLDKDEQKTLNQIVANKYMKKTIELIDNYIAIYNGNVKDACVSVFDELYNILNNAKPYVDKYLKKRKLQGEIKDEKQALKSIAGNSFSQALIYIFLKNKEVNNIKSNIYITSKLSKIPSYKDICIIDVDGETQKPDCDIVIYSLNVDKKLKKCIILSLKTSLRERAGQTYKWKLLMEIATTDNIIKEKYNIKYNPEVIPLVAFVTVNFYNEINNPQHRGMFKFFDKSFIAKDVNAEFISKMSTFVNYINENL